ncbi:recombination-associated protein rdgC [Oleiphilus messinensis]|uniref:Recombination-associated protein RdgC n=1 Tax=Oleiphilus messinensis TaxID=141451 RepID=A0A1Y0ICF5_9GAMM|nr:recombination-associated protein RdgC [Oleiphilus messinensis]ARU57145.1 recombination-associated protein rdgC [Oleiphilus messinensis]
MLFKNIFFYRFTKPFQTTLDEFETALASHAATPVGPHEHFRLGWSAPLGKNGQQLAHATAGQWMISLCREERLLPASVIKETLDERVQLIEDEQHRKVRKKEKDELKEQIVTELLPRAFKRSQFTYAYIDAQAGWLIVNASSPKKADELTSFLRKTLGSLPVRFPEVNVAPSDTMTNWLSGSGDLPAYITLNDEVELQSQSEEKSVVRCRGMDLAGEELQTHLKAEKRVVKLAIEWRERLSFVLNEDLSIKRLKFGDFVEDKLGEMELEGAAEKFDATFAIMSMELAEFLPELLEALGGEDRSKLIDEAA